MRAAALSALLFIGCAEPASLEVRVKVEVGATDLDKVSALTVRVRTEAGALVDCRLPKTGGNEGTCPFEAGDGQWDGAGDLRFVLYGDPDTAATVMVGAEHEGRTLTATISQVVLPSVAGARQVFDLILEEPATPQRGCSMFVAGGLIQAAVHLPSLSAELGPRALLVSAGTTLKRVWYESTNNTCKLTVTPVVDTETPETVGATWCKLRPGSLVVRRQELPTPHHVVAGICEGRIEPMMATRFAVVMAKLGPARNVEIRKKVIEGRRGAPSNPVLADTDGDGQLELILLSWLGNRWVDLRRYALEAGAVSVLAETGTSATTLVDLAGPRPEAALYPLYPFPPIVLPSPERASAETLVFVGYGGAAQYSDKRVLAFGAGTYVADRESLGPPVGYRLNRAQFAVVSRPRGCKVARARLVARDGRWQLQEADVVPISECRDAGLGRSVAAVTVGLGNGASAASVALSVGGRIYEANLEQSVDFEVSSATIPPASQAKLLAANIDGVAGAEQMTFRLLTDGKIELGGVENTRGWPLFLEGTGLGQYILGDLDGVADAEFGLRDLEIMSLSGRRLQVISLGLGSYDAQGLDWPSAGHSAHGGHVWIDGSDPGL